MAVAKLTKGAGDADEKNINCAYSTIICNYIFVQVLASEELSSEIISLSYKGSNKYMSWDLQIPQVQGLDSARVERSINRHLLKTVKHLKRKCWLKL